MYCPAGSAAPTPVTPGYFTVGVQFIEDLHNYTDDTIISVLNVRQIPCVPGSYCSPSEGTQFNLLWLLLFAHHKSPIQVNFYLLSILLYLIMFYMKRYTASMSCWSLRCHTRAVHCGLLWILCRGLLLSRGIYQTNGNALWILKCVLSTGYGLAYACY